MQDKRKKNGIYHNLIPTSKLLFTMIIILTKPHQIDRKWYN